MERIKSELEELIATGYDFEAIMDIGNGWEPYEGCTQNLLMILENPAMNAYVMCACFGFKGTVGF